MEPMEIFSFSILMKNSKSWIHSAKLGEKGIQYFYFKRMRRKQEILKKNIQFAADFEQESVGDEPPNIARSTRSTDVQRQEINEILNHDSLILLPDQSM